jgi:hypothetical protein
VAPAFFNPKQPEGHGCVGISSKGGDECCLDLVFLLESDLVVTRVAVKEREQDVASRSVEISVIHTHPPFIIVLF